MREQAEVYERTLGAEGGTYRGIPVVVVTSVGPRSGHLRKHCVMRVEHAGEYAVVASRGGAPEHPAWYHNLIAHPHVELQDEAVKRYYLARVVTGEERSTWWARAVAAWPNYPEYTKRTDRLIPVFVLSPWASDDGGPDSPPTGRQGTGRQPGGRRIAALSRRETGSVADTRRTTDGWELGARGTRPDVTVSGARPVPAWPSSERVSAASP